MLNYKCKTKDVQGQGPSNINLSLFVCYFDVCRASQPFPSINYGTAKWESRTGAPFTSQKELSRIFCKWKTTIIIGDLPASSELMKVFAWFSVNRSCTCVLPKHNSFSLVLAILSSYSTDTIQIKGYDIGYVTGMAIHRNTDGYADDWKLDKVTMVTDELAIYN